MSVQRLLQTIGVVFGIIVAVWGGYHAYVWYTELGMIRGQINLRYPADGDSFRIVGHPRPVRLWGIDAPEKNQTCTRPNGEVWECGRKSAEALTRLVGVHVLKCTIKDEDKLFNRDVVICFVGRTEINRSQVAEGWALAYTRFTRDYTKVEEEARRARRNIWSGTMIPPDQWRKGRR